jgi:hypothetical protein
LAAGFVLPQNNLHALTKRLSAAVEAVFILPFFSARGGNMHGLKVSRIKLDGRQINDALTQDLLQQHDNGKIVIATNEPRTLLSVVRKHWMKKLRRLHVERAKLLTGLQASRLAAQIAALEATTFTAKLPCDSLDADVTFATMEDLIRFCPSCKLIYVTYHVPSEKLYMLTAWMPHEGKVIIYER